MLARILINALMAIGFATVAHADCPELPSIEESFASNDNIAIVRVLSKVSDDPNDEYASYTYEVIVEKPYKGVEDQMVLKITGASPYVCPSYVMDEGESHLLWFDNSEEESVLPNITDCDRNRLASEADDDIAWLDRHTS